jgi:hypothetical protein
VAGSNPKSFAGFNPPVAVEVVDIAPAIRSTKLQTLFDYWLAKVDGLTPPRRTEIDPLDIPRLLPHIWIQERVAGTSEFRCRLAGEEVKAIYPENIVGRLFHEVIGDEAWKLVSEQYMMAVETPGVCHFHGPVYMHTIQRGGIGERLFMPMQDNDGKNAYIIGATIYTPMSSKILEEQAVTPRIAFTPLKALVSGA